jgi:hypothetical protein
MTHDIVRLAFVFASLLVCASGCYANANGPVAAASRGLPVRIDERQVGDFWVYPQVSHRRGRIEVDLVISMGMQPTPFDSARVRASLCDSAGRALRLVRFPSAGLLVTYGGPGYSALAEFEFVRDEGIGPAATLVVEIDGYIASFAVPPKEKTE